MHKSIVGLVCKQNNYFNITFTHKNIKKQLLSFLKQRCNIHKQCPKMLSCLGNYILKTRPCFMLLEVLARFMPTDIFFFESDNKISVGEFENSKSVWSAKYGLWELLARLGILILLNIYYFWRHLKKMFYFS